MRIVPSLAVAALAAVVALQPGGLAADQPKSKPAQKKELKKKLKAEAVEAAKKAELARAPVAKPAAVTRPAVPAKTVAAMPAPALARLIDEQLDRKLAEAKVSPAPPCSDAEFLRRAYLDITGVIPPADKAKAFLDSTDPDKRAKLVDELLASPNYGRHQADLWVPKLFPRDSANRFVLREPFVKWFETKFNANTPWDKLVTELLTATGTVEQNAAVTFFLANRSVDKLTDAVTQHFMGVQLQCAQCHNHPFTHWKQTEYWGVATFFSKVSPQNPRNANKGGDNTQIGVTEGVGRTRLRDFFPESTKTVPAKFLGGPEPTLSEREPYRPVFTAWLTSPENPYFARAIVNRTWEKFLGRGFVSSTEDVHEPESATHPELLTALSQQFAAGGYDLKNLIRAICATKAYQRSSKPAASGDPEEHRDLFAQMTVKVMTPEQLFDSLAQVTGFAAGRGQQAGKAAAANRPGGNNARDQFVQFFLAGAEQANTAEYEAGIPQALRLMNSRLMGNPNAVRGLVPTGARPEQVFEAIYLATLSRRPTTAEMANLRQYVAKVGSPTEAYGDILWAVLNSSEFTMVR